MKVNYLLCYVASLHKTKGVVPLTSGHLHTVTLANGSNTIIICDEVVKYLQMHYFTTWFLYSYMYTTHATAQPEGQSLVAMAMGIILQLKQVSILQGF